MMEEKVEHIRENFESYIGYLEPDLFDRVMRSFSPGELRRIHRAIYGRNAEKCKNAVVTFINRVKKYIA